MDLEDILNYRFDHPGLLRRAMTHRSYRHETSGVEEDNQRLEFLGDAVIDLLAAEKLFQEYPDAQEGQLSKLRSRYTSDGELADIARRINLGPHILLGRGEQTNGGHERASNLADAVEAIFGAIFLDRGLDAARSVFQPLFTTHDEWILETLVQSNPKGQLLEFSQEKWKAPPVYELVGEKGPAHEKSFIVKVILPNDQFAEGEGSSKRGAEAAAARRLLSLLEL